MRKNSEKPFPKIETKLKLINFIFAKLSFGLLLIKKLSKEKLTLKIVILTISMFPERNIKEFSSLRFMNPKFEFLFKKYIIYKQICTWLTELSYKILINWN